MPTRRPGRPTAKQVLTLKRFELSLCQLKQPANFNIPVASRHVSRVRFKKKRLTVVCDILVTKSTIVSLCGYRNIFTSMPSEFTTSEFTVVGVGVRGLLGARYGRYLVGLCALEFVHYEYFN